MILIKVLMHASPFLLRIIVCMAVHLYYYTLCFHWQQSHFVGRNVGIKSRMSGTNGNWCQHANDAVDNTEGDAGRLFRLL